MKTRQARRAPRTDQQTKKRTRIYSTLRTAQGWPGDAGRRHAIVPSPRLALRPSAFPLTLSAAKRMSAASDILVCDSEALMETPVILSAVRTPIGKFQGGLASLSAVDLGARAVAEAIRRSGLDARQIDEAI